MTEHSSDGTRKSADHVKQDLEDQIDGVVLDRKKVPGGKKKGGE